MCYKGSEGYCKGAVWVKKGKEGSRRVKNVQEGSSRFKKVPEGTKKVLEGSIRF